jgi:hypothetical protein
MIDSTIRALRFNSDRIDEFFGALSPEQLEREIAPGRSRVIYVWGHISALNDGLFPLFGLGPRVAPPIGYDQPGVAARIKYHGVGESLEVEILTGQELSGAIRKVLNNPSYRERDDSSRT